MYEHECVNDEEDNEMSTEILRNQKTQLVDSKQHLESCIKILPVYSFNSRYTIENLIKFLIRDRVIKPVVIKKTNDFISLKFGDTRFV